MSCRNRPEYIILGAGISGLSLAWFLKKYSSNPINITIIDQAKEVGGCIKTDHYADHLFERGPHTLRIGGEARKINLQLFDELGLTSEILTSSPAIKKKLIYDGSKIVPFFPHPLKLLRPKYFKRILKPIIQEKKVPKTELSDESIYAFFERRFNKYIADSFIAPMISGIYGGDIKRLSVQSCLPLISYLESENKSLIMSLIKHKKRNPSEIISFKGGMFTLPKRLEERLDARILLDSKIKTLQLHGEFKVILENEILRGDAIFSTLPGFALESLIKSNHKINHFYHPSSISFAIVHLGFKTKINLPKAFGYLMSEGSHEKIVGMIFDSQLFPEQNKSENEERITVMFKQNDLNQKPFFSKEYYIQEAIKALKEHLKIKIEPSFSKAHFSLNTIPQYEVGHSKKFMLLKKELEEMHPNFYLCGSSYHKVAVPECIFQAHIVAKEFIQPVLE